jgi:glycosyltransferase involved in cell wall biosynthesis
VIPAYDEEERIGRTVRDVPAFVDDVLVIDDASTDGTARAASDVGDARVKVIRHAKNRGVGAAIARGYAEARTAGADVVVVMAGDGQMDPADLPAVIAPVIEGRADYVQGNRLEHPRAGDMPLPRRIANGTIGWMTGHALGNVTLGDSQCGYTAISADLIGRLPLDRMWPRYGYPNDFVAWIALVGGRITEVPVRPVYAGERSGIRPWHALLMVGLLVRGGVRLRLGALGR